MERRKLVYDSGERLTSIHRGAVTAELTYGPLGRIATTVTGPEPRQVWSFGSLVERRLRADKKVQLERRIPGPLGVIASLRDDGGEQAIVYAHGDSRGNRLFTDGSGHVVQATTYGPYGRVTGEHGADAPLTYTDDLWNGGDDLRELGVVLLGPRAYDPEIGRFLQRDPVVHTGSSSTGNPYSFAFGDPVNGSDPTGLSPKDCPSCDGSLLATLLGLAASELRLGVSMANGGSGRPSRPKAPTAVPTIDARSILATWNANATREANARGAALLRARRSVDKFFNPLNVIADDVTESPEMVLDEGLALGEEMLDQGLAMGKCALSTSGGAGVLTGGCDDAGDLVQHAGSGLWQSASGIVTNPTRVVTDFYDTSPNARRLRIRKLLLGGAGIAAGGVLGVLSGDAAAARNAISTLPKKLFKSLKCVECTDAIVDVLKGEGIHGEVLAIRANSGFDYIVNDLVGTNPITRNGFHTAVRVGDVVFDNFFPHGVSYDTYVDSLMAPSGVTITKTPF